MTDTVNDLVTERKGRWGRGEVGKCGLDAWSTDGLPLRLPRFTTVEGIRPGRERPGNKYPPLHCSNKVGLLLYITNTKHHVIDIMHTSLHWFDEQFKTADLTFAVNYNLTQQMK